MWTGGFGGKLGLSWLSLSATEEQISPRFVRGPKGGRGVAVGPIRRKPGMKGKVGPGAQGAG